MFGIDRWKTASTGVLLRAIRLYLRRVAVPLHALEKLMARPPNFTAFSGFSREFMREKLCNRWQLRSEFGVTVGKQLSGPHEHMSTPMEMTKAIKSHCLSVLRAVGIKRAFPNHYPADVGVVSLANFRFDRRAEEAAISLGFADPERRNGVSVCRNVEARKLRLSLKDTLIEQDAATWPNGRCRLATSVFGINP